MTHLPDGASTHEKLFFLLCVEQGKLYPHLHGGFTATSLMAETTFLFMYVKFLSIAAGEKAPSPFHSEQLLKTKFSEKHAVKAMMITQITPFTPRRNARSCSKRRPTVSKYSKLGVMIGNNSAEDPSLMSL